MIYTIDLPFNFFLKKATIILLLCYYSFAIIAFPMCDFSMIADLPEMYQHCKETEDKDLTAIEFLTDHVVDFDIFF